MALTADPAVIRFRNEEIIANLPAVITCTLDEVNEHGRLSIGASMS